MSRFSRLILILLLGFEAGCQNARFWKRGSDQADRKATAAKADGKIQKKDADKSKFSFAGLTRRKQESSEKESDQAEPLIAEQEQQVEQLVKQGQQALEKMIWMERSRPTVRFCCWIRRMLQPTMVWRWLPIWSIAGRTPSTTICRH